MQKPARSKGDLLAVDTLTSCVFLQLMRKPARSKGDLLQLTHLLRACFCKKINKSIV